MADSAVFAKQYLTLGRFADRRVIDVCKNQFLKSERQARMNKPDPRIPDKPATQLIGCAVVALIAIGATSAVSGVLAILGDENFIGAGVLLFAAAASFGMLLNSVLRR